MPRIEVLPEQLVSAGSGQVTMAGELREVCSRLGSVRDSAAGGAGEARAAASMGNCCDAWSGALGALADAIETYGGNLTAAGGAYGETDAAAMPAGSGGG